MTKNSLNISAIVINRRDDRILLVEKEGNYNFFSSLLGLDIVFKGVDFGASISQYLSRLLNMSLDYITVLNFVSKPDPMTLYAVLTTTDLGSQEILSRHNITWIRIRDLTEKNSSSFLIEQLRRAVKICSKRIIATEFSSAYSVSAKRALAFLEQKSVKHGTLLGWPHYLGTGMLGALSTAIGVLCYLHSGKIGAPLIYESLNTIRNLQNQDGGWGIKSLVGESNNMSITEGSLWALWALIAAGYGSEDNSIIKGILWLEQTQRSSGGWGSSEESQRERVYPTAFAVRVLSQLDPRSNAVKAGVSWLQSARNKDGGWGVFSAESPHFDKSTALHTAHAILALLASGIPQNSDMIQEGVKWILSDYSELTEEGWPSQSEVEQVSLTSAIDYRHYATPWCVVALTQSGIPFYRDEILQASQRLLSKQHALGYWTHNLLPGQAPIWVTHDCIYALKTIVESASSRLDLILKSLEMEQQSLVMQDALLDVVRDYNIQLTTKPSMKNRGILIWNTFITIIIMASVFFNPLFRAQFASSPLFKSILSTILVILGAFATGFAPFIYQLAIEEYKTRRQHTKNKNGSKD